MTPPKLGSRTILCRNYTRRGRCSYGASCKFFHDPTQIIVSAQRKKRRDRMSTTCDDCRQDMHRLGSNSMSPLPEGLSPYIKYSLHYPGDALSGGVFWPQAICHSETSYPLVLQPDFRHRQTLSVTDTLALDPNSVGEGQYSVIEYFSVTKTPLYFQCHHHDAVRVRPPVEGAWSDPFTPRPPLSASSIAQSRSTRQFDAPNPTHVQNRTESSIPSSTFRSSIVRPHSRSHSLKDLVDELPLYPLVHSPLKDIQSEEMRSVTYEDLLTGARGKRPLRRQNSLSCF